MFFQLRATPKLYWPLQEHKWVDRRERCFKKQEPLQGLFFTEVRNIEHLTLMLTIYWNDWKNGNLPKVLPFFFFTSLSQYRLDLWNQVVKILFSNRVSTDLQLFFKVFFLSVKSLVSFPSLCKAKFPPHPLTQGMLL